MTLVLDFSIAWLISDNEINGKNINTTKYRKKSALKKIRKIEKQSQQVISLIDEKLNSISK